MKNADKYLVYKHSWVLLLFVSVFCFPLGVGASDNAWIVNGWPNILFNSTFSEYVKIEAVALPDSVICIDEPLIGNYGPYQFDFTTENGGGCASYATDPDNFFLFTLRDYCNEENYNNNEPNCGEVTHFFYVGCDDPEALNYDYTHESDVGACEYDTISTSTPDMSTTTLAVLGSINFSLAIIIVILFIFLIAFFFNQITAKKPWLHS